MLSFVLLTIKPWWSSRIFQLQYASGAGFDSRLCSFGGSGYASHFWRDRFDSFVFVFTL